MTFVPFLLKVLNPFKGYVFALLTLIIVWSVDVSLQPYLIKVIIDKIPTINGANAWQLLAIPLGLYFATVVFNGIFYRTFEWLWMKFSLPLRKQVGNLLMTHVMRQSHGFFQDQFAGNLATKISDCMGMISKIFQMMIENFLRNFLRFLVAIVTAWQVDAKFGIGMAVWGSLFLISAIYFLPHMQRYSKVAAENAAWGKGHIVDILSNITSVRLFDRYKREEKFIDYFFGSWVSLATKREVFVIKLNTLWGGSFIIFQAACLYWAVNGLQNHIVTGGDFALIFSLNIAIVDCLWTLAGSLGEFSENMGTVKQALEVLTAPIALEDSSQAKNLQVASGTIEFQNVTFGYTEASPLFQNLCVTIPGGQKVGLVGYSGGGKSTFANLILRLFEIEAGTILIDGQNITMATQSSLRQAIAMIPQDPYLFHRTLMDNIRYGNENATEEEVIMAAKRAYAHDFIMELPQKYEALIGERGVKLSGGQRQRIAIARAFLKDAPLLILDEATSQLDSITETRIQKCLKEMMQGKTTVVIAHRLSTLLEMDRIIVIDEGKIIEDGTHNTLLNAKGLYATLWQTQVGGFLPLAK